MCIMGNCKRLVGSKFLIHVTMHSQMMEINVGLDGARTDILGGDVNCLMEFTLIGARAVWWALPLFRGQLMGLAPNTHRLLSL